MKAYLDNNIVSAIAKDDTPAETDALNRLLAAYDDGKVHLVTSEVTHTEIKKYDVSMRPRVEWVFRLFKKVPIVRWDELAGINAQIDEHTVINAPIIQNDPIYDGLLALGLDTVDAQHVFVAAKNACADFLTCDKGILTRGATIAKLCGVTVQKPSDLVVTQGW